MMLPSLTAVHYCHSDAFIEQNTLHTITLMYPIDIHPYSVKTKYVNILLIHIY